jgi:RimJ/RimL family protein N-acetyltransferase
VFGIGTGGPDVNTASKLVLLGHAFDALGCQVVGLRTDGFNFRSQRAIEALGAKAEWPAVKRHLELRLDRHQSAE